MFRFAISILAALTLIVSAAFAQGARRPIETGADLHLACSVSLTMTSDDGTTAARAERHRCRNYLSGFVQASVVSRSDPGMTSPYSPSGEELFCYRLPDEMSWDEMEQLVVAYGDATPDALDMYAADFLVEVFVANYPCEEPTAEE